MLIIHFFHYLREELIFGEDLVTIGASNDLDYVASIARSMVKEWGMSDVVGRVALSEPRTGGPFMGRRLGIRQTHWGSKLLGLVDSEVERLVNNAYVKAKFILNENRDLLDHLASALAENEVVTGEEFQMMIIGFDAKVIEYGLMVDDKKRKDLPFQKFPKNI